MSSFDTIEPVNRQAPTGSVNDNDSVSDYRKATGRRQKSGLKAYSKDRLERRSSSKLNLNYSPELQQKKKKNKKSSVNADRTTSNIAASLAATLPSSATFAASSKPRLDTASAVFHSVSQPNVFNFDDTSIMKILNTSGGPNCFTNPPKKPLDVCTCCMRSCPTFLQSSCCCCKGRYNEIPQHTTSSQLDTPEPSRLNITKLARMVRFYLVGLFISLAICFSFVLTCYLLRRVFNASEFVGVYSIKVIDSTMNSSINETLLPDMVFPPLNRTRLHFDLNIEMAHVEPVLGCNFCYSLVWIYTCCLTLCYPLFALAFAITCRQYKPCPAPAPPHPPTSASTPVTRPTSPISTTAAPTVCSNATFSCNNILINSLQLFGPSPKADPAHRLAYIHTKRDFIAKTCGIALLWTLTGYSFVRALDLLHLSDLIVLFSVNASFIYMASWIVMHHKFIPLKLLGFILSVAAIIFTFYSEGISFNLKFLGNCFGTMSAAGSAVLRVIWKNVTKDRNNHQRTMLLTLTGLINLLLGWPLIFLLQVTGIETLSLSPMDPFTFSPSECQHLLTYLTIASIFGFIYCFLLLFGSYITAGIFTKFGCYLAILVSTIVDVEINKVVYTELRIGAVVSLSIGYIFLMLPDNLYISLSQRFRSESPDLIELNSLTRRYKHAHPSTPSPVLHRSHYAKASVVANNIL